MPYQAPDTHSRKSHPDAHNPADNRRRQGYLGLRLEINVLDKQRAGNDGKRVDDQYPADHPHDIHQQRLTEEPADGGSSQIKYDIQGCTDHQVEEEYRVIIDAAGIGLADQRIGKAAVDNRGRDGYENRNDSHDAIFRRGQQAGKHQAY